MHPLIAVPADPSMPSGHAWISFACATVLSAILPRRRAWLFGLATLIAVSRVYLGVHYPSDVLVGAAGGVVTGLIVLLGARLVHVHVGPDDDRDRGDQRQEDAPGEADRDSDGRGGAEIAGLGNDPIQHQ